MPLSGMSKPLRISAAILLGIVAVGSAVPLVAQTAPADPVNVATPADPSVSVLPPRALQFPTLPLGAFRAAAFKCLVNRTVWC